MKKALKAWYFLLFLSIAFNAAGQIVINEYVPANVTGVVNGNSDFNDWIELYNDGNSSVNLSGYGLSDDLSHPYSFRFPSYVLDENEYLVIFATGHKNEYPAHHWETAVKSSTSWKYFPGNSQPDTNWRNISFNDAGWSSGNGGIGYGDGDDQTTISTSCRSVMMRKTFNIADTSNILKAIFNIDYDDGFVAYLNGVEIARANIGVPGNRPLYNDLAIESHEAIMFQGDDPDSFFVEPVFLKSIIRQGVNVLAVEVHNQTSSSNDLTAIPFLSFGMKNSGSTFSTPPSWFGNPSREYYSTNFKLSRSGETLYLTSPSGTTIDQQTYTSMLIDNSRGRKPDGSNNWCLIKTPTPGATNNSATCYSGYANPPVFSIAAGFYPSSQNLVLTNSTPGGTIRYTTNGDEPTTSDPVYSSTLHLVSTKTIRARVFASGYLPSQIVTNTYVINEHIHLPVFSITTDSLNLWDYNTGIYVMGPNAEPNSPYKDANFWQDWEKPAAIEYYDKDQNRIFNFDAVIKIFGNYSRAKPQKSIEIKLKDQYGTGELNYVFIPDKPFIDKTDNFLLRNSGTDWNKVHFRDAFMERVLKPTHTGYLGTEPIVMYLNGSFWGVFTIHENHDHHWIKNNFNYKEDEIDYLIESGNDVEEKNGTDVFFYDSYNYATTTNPNASTFYDDMNNFWDLDNYKDYFIAETYYNNGDWIGDWTNNIKMWRPREAGGKFRYLLYDLDFGLGFSGSYQDNTLHTAIAPAAFSLSSNIFGAMLGNAQFKREFINRYADLINTIFKPSSMLGIMHQFQDSMSPDMPKHFAKWGSSMNNWQDEIDDMTSFINNRPAKVRDQIEAEFNLASQVTLTFKVSPAGSGRIQISTIIPTSLPWTGVYFNGNPVTITAIPNPGFTFDRWNSANTISNDHDQVATYNFSHNNETITAYFSGSSQPAQLAVSEFNYNSDSTIACGDWIELHNYGSGSLDISGWSLKDQDENSTYVFPVGTVISANGYLVVASNLNKFSAVYPAVTNVVGPLGFDLSNSGDQIRIFDPNNSLYLSFFYMDVVPWPVEADGSGFTCELTANTANPNNGNNWFPGCMGGSPGRQYTAGLSTPTHISGNTTFCPGGHTLLAVNYTSGYSYHWQRNWIDIPSATDTIYDATLAGTYTVRVVSQGCSSNSDTVNVLIVTSGQPPVVTSATRCGEGSLTISATSTDSIYWFDAPNGNILGTGPTFTTPTLTNSTTYYAQTSLSCPSTPVAVHAQINPVTATPVVSNISRCGPGAVTINAVDTATVHWFNDPVGGAQIYSGNIFVTGYIPHDTIFYAEAGTTCVSERVEVNINVISSPPPIVHDASRCGPGSLVLNASSLAPVYWYDSLIGGSQVGSGVNYLTQILSATTTYYAESNNGCASYRVPASAMVNPIPSPPVASDSSHCGPGSMELFATANFQIFWYSTPINGTALGSGSLFTTPNISTTTTYYAASTDICSSTRIPVHAIINPLPAPPVGNDANICGSGTALLSASASDPIFWFSQSTGSPVLGIGNNYTTPVLNSTTTYYAVAIANCSSIPTPVTATVTNIPVSILGNDTTILSGSSLILDAGAGYDSYLWSTGATTRTITVNSADSYSVEVSLNGCTGTDVITVSIILGIQESSTLNGYINLFPNPVKDRLTIQFESKKSLPAEISIYDMAGHLLRTENIKVNGGLNSYSFEMTDYAKGIYLLTLRSTDFTKTLSIAVE